MHVPSVLCIDLFSLLFRNNENKWLFPTVTEAADATFFDFGDKIVTYVSLFKF